MPRVLTFSLVRIRLLKWWRYAMAMALSMLIGAGAGLVGDVMSQQGQQSANVMSTQNMLENQQWQERMSDTAMQRRVSDYRAAGLNPMLAAGGPGAVVGSPVMPNIQNPNVAFGAAGGQVTSAMQAGANIEQTKAQTDLIRAQTPGNVYAVKEDGTPDFTNATGGALGNMQLATSMQQIRQADATIKNVNQMTEKARADTSVSEYQAQLSSLNVGILKQTQQWAVKQAIAEAQIDMANVSSAEATNKIMSTSFGPFIKAIQSLLGAAPISSAVGAMGTFTRAAVGR